VIGGAALLGVVAVAVPTKASPGSVTAEAAEVPSPEPKTTAGSACCVPKT
jgi:hypothetical protein